MFGTKVAKVSVGFCKRKIDGRRTLAIIISGCEREPQTGFVKQFFKQIFMQFNRKFVREFIRKFVKEIVREIARKNFMVVFKEIA